MNFASLRSRVGSPSALSPASVFMSHVVEDVNCTKMLNPPVPEDGRLVSGAALLFMATESTRKTPHDGRMAEASERPGLRISPRMANARNPFSRPFAPAMRRGEGAWCPVGSRTAMVTHHSPSSVSAPAMKNGVAGVAWLLDRRGSIAATAPAPPRDSPKVHIPIRLIRQDCSIPLFSRRVTWVARKIAMTAAANPIAAPVAKASGDHAVLRTGAPKASTQVVFNVCMIR